MEIGKKIKDLRIAKGLTQEELADRSELSKGFISQLERDLTSPSIATLTDILQVLGSSLNEFFYEAPEEQIVFRAEDYFVKTDPELNNTIERVKKNFNEGLHYEGILFTMYVERYKVTGQIVKEVKKYFPKQVFETVIPRNIALSEAPSFGMPALYYDKKSKGSKAYEALAKEILKNEKKRRE